MSLISTHVLDVTAGAPAVGVEVHLVSLGSGEEALLAQALTDADGRVGSLGPDTLAPGDYRLRFHVGAYFDQRRLSTLYPNLTIDFRIGPDHGAHLHLPVLISPFAYSTYRGS